MRQEDGMVTSNDDPKMPKPGRLFRWWPFLPWTVLVILLALNIVRTRTMSDHDYAREAIARVVKQAGPHARVIVVAGDGAGHRACGWVDLGAPRGVATFEVSGRPREHWSRVSIDTPFGDSLKRQAESIYHLALSRQRCAPDLLTPPPAGFALSQQTLDRLASLWGEPPKEWVVFQPPGRDVLIGLQRRSGGGVIITPPFRTALEVDAWIRAKGDALAAREQTRGEAAFKADEACLERSKDRTERDRCGAGLDETVEFDTTAAAS
jgi:hypothetical protein